MDIGILILAFDNPHKSPDNWVWFHPFYQRSNQGPLNTAWVVSLGMGIHDQMHPNQMHRPLNIYLQIYMCIVWCDYIYICMPYI